VVFVSLLLVLVKGFHGNYPLALTMSELDFRLLEGTLKTQMGEYSTASNPTGGLPDEESPAARMA